MQRAVDDLAGALEKQIRNYSDLKSLILEKRKAIVSNDLKHLANVTLRIETLIASNNRLEIDRMAHVRKIAEELGLAEAKPTLARIAGRFAGTDRERLLDLRHRAGEAITEVQRQNRINAELLRYNAELMDSVLRSLVETESCESTYGSTGRAKSRGASVSLLDRQV